MSYKDITKESFETKIEVLTGIVKSPLLKSITETDKVREICESLREEDYRFDFIKWMDYIHKNNIISYEGYLEWIERR